MRLEIERRPGVGPWLRVASPLIAVGVTVLLGAILFASLGKSPTDGLYTYFVEPLTDPWSLHEIAVKAAPLILIGAGLCVCFRSGNWNIGAEGQFTLGAITAASLPVLVPAASGPWVLPAMAMLGLLGGAAWAAIPAVLRNRFAANEILVSLMLVYVAGFLLDWLVRGPWRNPEGFNFPETRSFDPSAILPELISTGAWGGRANWGFVIAVLVSVAVWWLVSRTLKGYELTVTGHSARAARFGGFDAKRTTLFAFVVSGALAGLAGMIEVSGAIGQLRPQISPGYGFIAIIVAFLARLNPLGAILAGLALAVTHIGGEAAQLSLGISERIARVFQGLLLFSVLATDTLVTHRIRVRRTAPVAA